MTKVTVYLFADVADQLLRGAAETKAANDLLTAVRALGVELRPIHPGTTDPTLRSTFVAQAGDRAHAHQIISRLRPLPATQAAYIKPERPCGSPVNVRN